MPAGITADDISGLLDRTCGALARLSEAKLPYIVVLTHPTTGGVTASFAMLGDLNIAEPGALIGFAGPRVIEQTIREKLPAGFQRSEFLVEHGMLDFIAEHREMRDVLVRCLHESFAELRRSKRAPPKAAARRKPKRTARTAHEARP